MTTSPRPSRTALVELICQCLREVLEERDMKTPVSLGELTTLLGPSAVLDSLGLVRLIAATEEEVAARHGVSVTLADERALSETNSPFRSVGALADFVATALADR